MALHVASDLVILAGSAAIVFGVRELHTAAAWIVGGAMAIGIGWILGLRAGATSDS